MSSRVRRTFLTRVWLVAALGAVPLGAQPSTASAPTPAWVRARLDGRFDARSREAVERVIDSAYAAGIPADPLVTRALEGRSKGAAPEAIVRVLRALAADLSTARRALGTKSLPTEVATGADALRAGVEARVLERLRHDRPDQPLVVALGVLTDLIQTGVPVDVATKSVLELTKAGIADEQLVAFRRDVERDVGLGASPASAALVQLTDVSASLATDGTVIAAPPGGRASGVRKLKP